MNLTEKLQQLQTQRKHILNQLFSLGNFRPGNLRTSYQRCGKPNCRCAQPDDPGHGPYWILARTVKGKIFNRSIPRHALEATQEQIDNYHCFRDLTEQLVEVNEALCHTQLKAGKTAKKGAMQKAARVTKSQPDSQPKSVVKSKRSSHRTQLAK